MYFSYKSQYHNKLGCDLLNDPSTVHRRPQSPAKMKELPAGNESKGWAQQAAFTYLFIILELAASLGCPLPHSSTVFPSFPLFNRFKARKALPKEYHKPIMKPTPVTDKFSFAFPFPCYVTLDI